MGGLRDTVQHLDVGQNSRNGFLFETHDSAGLLWALQEAMTLHRLPETARNAQIRRIMTESVFRFNPEVMTDHYLALYAKLLKRPMVMSQPNRINGERWGRQSVIIDQETVV